MSAASFHEVISEHLALRERNKRLERLMPLDEYRGQVGGAMTRVYSSTPSQDDFDTETVVNTRQEHWLDPDSFWDASRERPMPEFDWGDD
jgi:hypothetical protein